jgi:signal transduction histidine kinase
MAYILLTIALLLLVSLVFYFRFIARQMASTMRQSLSDDIHDEIGSMLTKTAMRTELLRHKTGGQYPELQQIENNLREAVQSMRNLLWTFDKHQNRTSDLVNRIRHTIDFIFVDTDFNCIVTDRSSRLKFDRPFEVKRNVIFIIRELANNALKYSNGNQFEVVIRYRGGKWKLDIADNGYNPEHDKQLPMKGNGLKSIVRRMKLINGDVNFRRDEHGFFVELIF